jgi:hypothetical protein
MENGTTPKFREISCQGIGKKRISKRLTEESSIVSKKERLAGLSFLMAWSAIVI